MFLRHNDTGFTIPQCALHLDLQGGDVVCVKEVVQRKASQWPGPGLTAHGRMPREPLYWVVLLQ